MRDAHFPGREILDGRKTVFTLSATDLNLILNYSLMSAPLDTAFLQINSKIMRAWIPLGFISSLDGLWENGGGRLLYVPDVTLDEFCLPIFDV